jgi:hypothetical protein
MEVTEHEQLDKLGKNIERDIALVKR